MGWLGRKLSTEAAKKVFAQHAPRDSGLSLYGLMHIYRNKLVSPGAFLTYHTTLLEDVPGCA